MAYNKQDLDINDLSLISGINKHTIRIWEKRFSILDPKRTNTNTRIYNIGHLQKILNIVFLKNNGYKISRLAKLSDAEVSYMCLKVNASNSIEVRAMNSLIVAIIIFDQPLFQKTFIDLTHILTFSQIFEQIFMPLLDQIYYLHQTQIINPIHNHFLEGLIKENLNYNISLLERDKDFSKNDCYILFSPKYEKHEIELLFLYYELLLRKRRAIFLSGGVPQKNLKYICKIHPNPTFISYIGTTLKEVPQFLREFELEICKNSYKELILFGPVVQPFNFPDKAPNLKVYKSISNFLNDLDFNEPQNAKSSI